METHELSHGAYTDDNRFVYKYKRLRIDPLGLTPVLAGLTSGRIAHEIHVFEECPADSLFGAHILDMLRDELRARELSA